MILARQEHQLNTGDQWNIDSLGAIFPSPEIAYSTKTKNESLSERMRLWQRASEKKTKRKKNTKNKLKTYFPPLTNSKQNYALERTKFPSVWPSYNFDIRCENNSRKLSKISLKTLIFLLFFMWIIYQKESTWMYMSSVFSDKTENLTKTMFVFEWLVYFWCKSGVKHFNFR